MHQSTLLFGALLAIVCAGIYYYVGRVLQRRHTTSADTRLAWRLFIAWWYALATTSLFNGLLSLLGYFGVASLPLFTTMTLTNILAVCVALYGLVYYLMYLYTGSRKILIPLSVFYILYYMLLVYFIQARKPIDVEIGRWQASLVYQNQIRGPLFSVAATLLFLPPILGAVAYLLLYFRVENITQKYRILLVSLSIIVWFLSSSLAAFSGFSELDIWQIISRFIGVAAALAILLAYQPPVWVRQRFGVRSLTEERA